MSRTALLFIAFLASAITAIACQQVWPALFWPYALLKPLTTALVIAYAAGRGRPGETRRQAMLVGLGLSLCGDVALLWPQQGFLPGLVAFLGAHLAYLVAFTRGVRLGASPIAYAGYALLAGCVLAVLWPGVPMGLRVPVAAYVLCLAAMAAQAASAWRVARGTPPAVWLWRAALGGLLFLVSDALLAFNRFHTPLPLAGLLILATYWAAQWLIASALPPRHQA